MTSRHSNPLKSILHPYIFVLKEGRSIKNDFLDYSLMMLFVHSGETIQSPSDEIRKVRKKAAKDGTDCSLNPLNVYPF